MYVYSKTCVKRPLSKRPKIDFQGQLSKVLQNALLEHSAILSTFIKLSFVTESNEKCSGTIMGALADDSAKKNPTDFRTETR